MSGIITEIRETLLSLKDEKYREFQCSLMPTVPQGSVIGVRTPELRRMAKKLRSRDSIADFLHDLPHKYYEENNLHAFIICEIRDYEKCAAEVERFLPYVNNWATCDSMRPVCFKSNRAALRGRIDNWLRSSHIYTVRYGIGMLMVHFLDADFSPEYPEKAAAVKSDEYYVNMMIAWYFATALAKQYDCAVKYLEEAQLSPWVHNKTIQKAVESYRIPDDTKEYLRSLRRR